MGMLFELFRLRSVTFGISQNRCMRSINNTTGTLPVPVMASPDGPTLAGCSRLDF
jgi:hypothetical protein